MPTLAAVVTYTQTREGPEQIESIAASPLVAQLFLVGSHDHNVRRLSEQAHSKTRIIHGDFFSGSAINQLIEQATTDYLLFCLPGEQIELGQRAIERLVSSADDSGTGLVYSDFKDDTGDQPFDHPLIDYQFGSIRDGFEFGAVFLLSRPAVESAIRKHGTLDERLRWAGHYELRLKLSIDSAILRIPEPLYTRMPLDRRATGERQFDYVDPRQREYQIEMEQTATAHLKRIGAYLEPEFRTPPKIDNGFPVRASIVIPVRNRERTIQDAVRSALSQRASFEFNVIVVDNHSTDNTTAILEGMASARPPVDSSQTRAN